MEITIFNDIKDPRINRTKKFSLSEIVFTTFVAIWSGARSSYEISKFTKDNLPIFKEFLPFNNGVPSHDTYNRFFSILPEEDFERAFIAFAQYLIGDSFDAKLIKFDKKPNRSTTKISVEIINTVIAWSNSCKLSLGHDSVDNKSDAITAITLLANKLNDNNTN